MTSSVCQAHGHERPESSTWNYQTRTHFVFHVAFKKKTKQKNLTMDEGGIPFSSLSFLFVSVIVTLPFFSLLSNWRFPLVLSFLFFNIWLLTKKITHTHTERGKKKRKIFEGKTMLTTLKGQWWTLESLGFFSWWYIALRRRPTLFFFSPRVDTCIYKN